MKTNIKMRVTPEQSRRVQEICFKNGIQWRLSLNTISHINKPYLAIEPTAIFYRSTEIDYLNISSLFKEIDADLFIRTYGTCEETQKPSYRKTKILNQKKELHKLNLKLQKCISLEEHDLKMKNVLNEKHYLEKENKSLKESSKISCNMLHSQKDKIYRLELNYVIEQSNYKKEIEKLKAVIEYLESKVK